MNIPFFSQRKNRAPVTAPVSRPEKSDPVDIILNYHEETKHHYYRYARSLGYLDWDTQPDPFRRFVGSPIVNLPLLPAERLPTYDQLFIPGAITAHPVTLEGLSRFFRNALAVSAWKRYESARWALRVNPSSGNLHPTEGYLILGDGIPDVPAGVYHYAPGVHALEQRAEYRAGFFSQLVPGLFEGAFLVGLSSIHWREAWKYGERAFRYCQHDIGHALGALRFSAAVLGWRLVVLEQLSDAEVAILLGLNRAEDFEEAEDEHPDLVAAVIPCVPAPASEIVISSAAWMQVSLVSWQGHASRLSASHVEWPLIDNTAVCSIKGATEIPEPSTFRAPETVSEDRDVSAEQIIQQRRSCLSLDGETSMPAQSFYKMMMRAMPSLTVIPFDALEQSALRVPRTHLVLFVHRVDGVLPGLYLLVREPGSGDVLRAALHSRFVWEKPANCPSDLPLFLLEEGDFQQRAAGLCCGQAIGGDGVFSVAMLAAFEAPIRSHGAWFYRRLFWETGLIGQILYLESEAAGIRSTGIGCFFDDPVHELLGLKDHQFQSLYHFTVGAPLEDARLTTEPAYVR